MTHELRTPLNSILGYSQILLKEDGKQIPPRDALQTIHHSGEHMLSLIDGLLDLARIEAGRLQLERMPLPLPEFLDEVVRMVRPQAEAKGLAFVFDQERAAAGVGAGRCQAAAADPDQPAGERGALHRRRHGDAARRCAAAGARFDVVDTGIGVAPQDHQRIFLPFERGAAGRQRGEPGTGLGLTITGLLTSLMGGELTLTSSSPAGSTFGVRVYLREVRRSRRRRPSRSARSQATSARAARCWWWTTSRCSGRCSPACWLRWASTCARPPAAPSASTACASTCPRQSCSTSAWTTWMAGRRQRSFAPPASTRCRSSMVSANVFENQGERLRMAGCQAFIGKPVIESELIMTLERHLGLEWMVPGHAPPPAEAAPPQQLRLPEDARAELMSLVQLGHVRGLQRALDRLAAEDATLAASCSYLRRMVMRFELEDFKKALSEDLLHVPNP